MPPTSTVRFATPDEALAALLSELRPVGTESLPWQETAGRVLAHATIAPWTDTPCVWPTCMRKA